MSEKRKRMVHIIFKRKKTPEGMDGYGQPQVPNPVLLDKVYGSWERSSSRCKTLQKWGYETATVEMETSPDEEFDYKDGKLNPEKLKFW